MLEILKGNELHKKGILIEYDAGYISHLKIINTL